MLFHEASLTEEARGDIARSAKFPVKFAELKFTDPSPPVDIGASIFKMGYRHMCHFFADDIFHRPELAEFDYYMRLDTDSFILSPVKTDLFECMESKSAVYGYITEDVDSPECSAGLWPLAEKFTRESGLETRKAVSEIPEPRCYYTNFEICDLAWFRRSPWRDFFAAVDKANGIYTTRWGDHIIRYIGVNLFAPPEAVAVMPVHYFHRDEFGSEFSTSFFSGFRIKAHSKLRKIKHRAIKFLRAKGKAGK
jgi:hypothetical protein